LASTPTTRFGGKSGEKSGGRFGEQNLDDQEQLGAAHFAYCNFY